MRVALADALTQACRPAASVLQPASTSTARQRQRSVPVDATPDLLVGIEAASSALP